MEAPWLQKLESKLELKFRDGKILTEALTNISFSNENPGTPNNKRLQFLGDAVINLVIGEYFYKTNPSADQEFLTESRKHTVERIALAKAARKLRLENYLRTGKGETREKSRADKPMEDTYEALIGAIYLEFGLPTTSRIVVHHLIEAK